MFGDIEADEKNRDIMNFVLAHPQATATEIGKEVGLKRDAMSKRMTKLYSTGKLKRQIIVDLDALGFNNRFRIDVKISPIVLRARTDDEWLKLKATIAQMAPQIKNDQVVLALELMQLEEEDVMVEDAAVILGSPADLTLTVRAKALKSIFDFVTAKLRPVPGVLETATCIESWSIHRDPTALATLETLTRTANERKEKTIGEPRTRRAKPPKM